MILLMALSAQFPGKVSDKQNGRHAQRGGGGVSNRS